MCGLQHQITVFERLLRKGATWLKKTDIREKQRQPLVNSFMDYFRNIFKRERVMCILGLIEALMGTD